MERIVQQSGAVLQRSSAAMGGVASLAAIFCLSLPEAVADSRLGIAVTCLVVLVGCAWQSATSAWTGWVVITGAAGTIALVTLGIAGQGYPSQPLLSAIALVAGGSLGSLALVLVTTRKRVVALITGYLITVLSILVIADWSDRGIALAMAVTASWASGALLGVWLARTVPRLVLRIASIGRAHQAERNASEREAERRQGARLMHDTVLATLTLLAHSGVGVSEEALRAQAAEDAQLLRQLRLGGSPMPQASGVYKLDRAAEYPLGNTLESVKQRFTRMGLTVNWHGSGIVLLPTHVLDSFLLALGECLENVRRHAGVTHADVTITDDDATVRAMVTDAGVGFDANTIDPERFGLNESIMARLHDVGGRARLFSSPGAGTTVVLEAPK